MGTPTTGAARATTAPSATTAPAPTATMGSEPSEAPVVARRSAATMGRVLESKNAQTVREAAYAEYDAKITPEMASALVELAGRKSGFELPRIFASKDPAIVQGELRSLYGVALPIQMVADLSAFVEKRSKGD